MIKLAVILGTRREGRRSENALNYVLRKIEAHGGFEVDVIDPREYSDLLPQVPHKILNPQLEAAEAFLIVTPEYNHSIPADLKELLDTDFEAYNHKPVVIAGVSEGPWGGLRVIEALIHVLKDFNMYVLNRDIRFTNMKTFDQSIDDARLDREIGRALDELAAVAPVLAALRQ